VTVYRFRFFGWSRGCAREDEGDGGEGGSGEDFFGVVFLNMRLYGRVDSKEDRVVAPGVSLGCEGETAATQDVGDVAIVVFAEGASAVSLVAQ
jgi:hypothetical protein